VTSAIGPAWLDSQHLLQQLGGLALWGTAAVVFAECGLFVFFMPGDSLLFTVGLFVGKGTIHHPLWLVCLVLSIAAFAGNAAGYEIGRKAGPALFHRPDSRIFKQQYVDQTVAFFDKYGARAIVLARFVPIVRTFITVTAGIGRMDRRLYLGFSAIGGVIWASGITILGYSLGQVTFVRQHIQPHLDVILLGVVVLSLVPAAVHLVRTSRSSMRDRGASE